MLNRVLRWIISSLAILALAASVGLLLADGTKWVLPWQMAAVVSAAPLLLVGTSFLLLQPVVRPRWSELLKNAVLAGTFLLWGAVQLMPQNVLSKRLGDVVITLYVLDLAWVTLGVLNSSKRAQQNRR